MTDKVASKAERREGCDLRPPVSRQMHALMIPPPSRVHHKPVRVQTGCSGSGQGDDHLSRNMLRLHRAWDTCPHSRRPGDTSRPVTDPGWSTRRTFTAGRHNPHKMHAKFRIPRIAPVIAAVLSEPHTECIGMLIRSIDLHRFPTSGDSLHDSIVDITGRHFHAGRGFL